MTKTEALVEDAVLYIPRATIHPDPDQPRVKVDAELQASIDSEGIIQAITVRPHPAIEDEWMIVDGERRWLGAAHLKTIPCRIRLDLEEPVDRLITQLSANTGKPLSPIEQARAFKKALDEGKNLSQIELAKRLGVPRSTIGDRIRLVTLDAAWLKLIDEGKLQVSHGPELHLYAGVPSKYQAEAAKKIRDEAGKSKDPISVDGFRWDLQEAFRPYLRELAEVSPQYKGPVVEVPQYGGKRKYAADPEIWQPILADKKKRARAANKSSGSSGRTTPRFESAFSKVLKEIKAAGYDVPVRKETSAYATNAPKAGETKIFADNNWADGIHPKTLLEKLDPTTLTVLASQYGSQQLVTTDAAAVVAAREAYQVKAVEASKKALAPLRAKLADSVIDGYRVNGPGAKSLVRYLDPDRGDESIVAMAIGVTLNLGEDPCTQADAEKLLAALAACQASDIKIPNSWTVENQIRQAMGNPAFKVAKNKTAAATEPKSKKQQKRAARAARKQVGDPTRAAKETGTILDEEVVEEDNFPFDEVVEEDNFPFDEEQLIEIEEEQLEEVEA